MILIYIIFSVYLYTLNITTLQTAHHATKYMAIV